MTAQCPARRGALPSRILIYLFPALMDMVVSLILFVSTIRVAKMGANASTVSGVITVWSLLYMCACPVAGRFVTPANAARMMVACCASVSVLCVLFTVLSSLIGIYVLMLLVGAAVAFFFAPFQVFMKAVDTADGRPVTYSTGIYTFAWSMGFATGPFVSGFLMELGSRAAPGAETVGWKYAYAFGAVAAALTAAGLYGFQRQAARPAAPAGPAQPAAPAGGFDYSRMPDLAWLGWVGAGAGIVVLSIIRSVFPARAVTALHMADSTQGLIFFVLNIAQALTGLALTRSRLWMYRPWAVGAFGLVGVVGCAAFGLGSTPAAFEFAAACFGVYSGAFFFYLVFHSLTHPSRSAHYVAINESVVGVCGIIGPMLGGVIADLAGFGYPYLAGALVVAVATAFQCGVHRRHGAV